MNDFMPMWRQFHSECAPVNDLLKYAENDRWLRFHSLPQSKRYATTEEQVDIILNRQNILAHEVLGDGANCWMSSHLYVWDGVPNGDELWRDSHHDIYGRWHMPKVDRIANPDEECDYEIYATQVNWKKNHFDVILRQIANDEVRVMWMSIETGAVFAPYDGGVDLILPKTADISSLAFEHSDWLSSYRDGW